MSAISSVGFGRCKAATLTAAGCWIVKSAAGIVPQEWAITETRREGDMVLNLSSKVTNEPQHSVALDEASGAFMAKTLFRRGSEPEFQRFSI